MDSPKIMPSAVRITEADYWTGNHTLTGAEWSLFCGDARQVVSRLERDAYQCVITSPPYFWQRDYGVDGQIGMESTVGGYVDALCDTMDAVKEVLHPKGVLFLNLGDTYYSGKGQPKGSDRKHNARRFSSPRAVDMSGLGLPKKTLLGIPWRVALSMIDRGWILRSAITWKRSKAVPEPNARDRPWRTSEFIFLFVKNRTYRFTRGPLEKRGEEDVWTIESQSRAGRGHPAVFPPELVQRCLAVGNPDRGRVLDPFAGSGTVLKEAVRSGMEAHGIDLSPEFCRLAVRDISGM